VADHERPTCRMAKIHERRLDSYHG
jgi:hypothetical protein